ARNRSNLRTSGRVTDPGWADYSTGQLHLVHARLRHVRIDPLSRWALRAGLVAKQVDGAALADLLCESDDLSKLGSALCDSPGSHYRFADEQRERRTGRKWSPQRVRWLQPNDPLGSGERFVLHSDHADSVHRESTSSR